MPPERPTAPAKAGQHAAKQSPLDRGPRWAAHWRRRQSDPQARNHYLARKAIYREIRAGRMTPERCACGSAGPTQAHHLDYDDPLRVVWLCARCHELTHRPRRK